MEWFSKPQWTVEEAQALYNFELFVPAAVFETQNGQYVMSRLSPGVNWPPHSAALEIYRLTGNLMVSHCDPVLGVWRKFQPPDKIQHTSNNGE